MRFIADLHLHSRYSTAVSSAMTVETIARWAQRKGLNLLGTGDCLQTDWLREVENAVYESERGFFALRPEIEERIAATLPPRLRHPVRFVLSTEVNCAPRPGKEIQGIHFLIFFPSFESVRRFREKLLPHGDLRQGRPTLDLSPIQLLELLLDHDEECYFVPAHVINPWFSALGTVGGSASLEEIFGDLALAIPLIETGLTSTPFTCRRLSCLDGKALFSNSDAHSPNNMGREYTVLQIEPDYRALFSALREGSSRNIIGTVKYPLRLAKYYLNWCSSCQTSFAASSCPKCGGNLVPGARDRLEQIADRKQPILPFDSPPFQERLPLPELVATTLQQNVESKAVERLCRQMINTVGNERTILMEASEEQLAAEVTPQFARVIIRQRTAPTEFFG